LISILGLVGVAAADTDGVEAAGDDEEGAGVTTGVRDDIEAFRLTSGPVLAGRVPKDLMPSDLIDWANALGRREWVCTDVAGD